MIMIMIMMIIIMPSKAPLQAGGVVVSAPCQMEINNERKERKGEGKENGRKREGKGRK